jgi:SAM-dependent methyltransferase
MSADSRRTVLDPIAAYNAFAPGYSGYSQSRLPYLESVEHLITARIAGAHSLLDIGSGDGCRACRIAESAQISEIVLVEPSGAMRNLCMADCEVWNCKASEIPRSTRRFDVITCLWNVLGHIEAHDRRPSLARLKQLLSPSGTIFLDINHRYNAAEYGWPITCVRRLRDLLFWSESNGDMVLDWKVGERVISTRGHVFTPPEMDRLFRSASLRVRRLWIVDYKTGAERSLPWLGNLLYQLQA